METTIFLTIAIAAILMIFAPVVYLAIIAWLSITIGIKPLKKYDLKKIKAFVKSKL